MIKQRSAVMVYRASEGGALGRDFGLRDQIRRSAVSIASNLAEGDERNTDKESVRFFYIVKKDPLPNYALKSRLLRK